MKNFFLLSMLLYSQISLGSIKNGDVLLCDASVKTYISYLEHHRVFPELIVEEQEVVVGSAAKFVKTRFSKFEQGGVSIAATIGHSMSGPYKDALTVIAYFHKNTKKPYYISTSASAYAEDIISSTTNVGELQILLSCKLKD